MSQSRPLHSYLQALYAALQGPVQKKRPDFAQTLRLAIKSGDPEFIESVYRYLLILDIDARDEPEEEPALFHEPGQRELHGDIYLGDTPGGKKASFALSCFQRGHVEVDGATGSGKSTLINFIAPQITRRVPVTIYDPLDQHSCVMPADFLVQDFGSYERNPFDPPDGADQLVYARQVAEWMQDLFHWSAVTRMVLIEKCSALIAAGEHISVRTLIANLKAKDASEGAILERLRQLPPPFHVEMGMDLAKLFSRPLIFNIVTADIATRKFILHDHLCFFSFLHPARPMWRLKHVFIVHESRDFTRRDEATAFMGRMLRQVRNNGLGTIWCEQAPHTVHDDIRANITSRFILKLPADAGLAGMHTALGLDKDQAQAIHNLPRQQMIVKREDISHPFMVKVPNISLPEASEEELADRKRRTVAFLGRRESIRRLKPADDSLVFLRDPDLLRLYHHVVTNPDWPHTKRDRDLGFRSKKKAEMLRKKLVGLGLAVEAEINPGTPGGWFKTLRPIASGGKRGDQQGKNEERTA